MSEVVTYPLTRRVLEMEESATIRMAKLSRELAAQGHKVISLSLGEPDFDTPAFIKEAAKKALDEGKTKYTPVAGVPELKKAIQKKFREENNLHFELNQIVISTGAKQSISNVVLSLIEEGDEVVVLSPYWVSYSEIVKLSGGKSVEVYAGIEQDYKVTAQQVADAITPRTKLLMFSSPCNPTGSVYSEAELKAIADVVAQHENLFILADEIYEYITFTGKHVSIGAFENVRDRTITINGFSKGFAMTGWRLGYIGGPVWLADACDKIQGQITSGTNSFSQYAAAVALDADRSEAEAMKVVFQSRRDLVLSLLGDIPGLKVNKPEGAFYVFPDISSFFGKSAGEYTIHTANDFCEYLLQKALVGSVTGEAFGAPNCFRISYAASEENLIEAVRRIKEACAALK